VKQQIGAFADQRGIVVAHRLDDRLDRLLPEFLRRLAAAAHQQLGRVGGVGIGIAAGIDDAPQLL